MSDFVMVRTDWRRIVAVSLVVDGEAILLAPRAGWDWSYHEIGLALRGYGLSLGAAYPVAEGTASGVVSGYDVNALEMVSYED